MVSLGPRTGAARLTWLVFLASAGIFATLVAVLTWDLHKRAQNSDKSRPLIVLCAAALKVPVEQVAKEYEKEFGVPIELQFGASQTLLAEAEIAHRGDLFLPADDSYLQMASAKQLLAEKLPLAHMTGVLVVKKGNPLKIQSLDDLLSGRGRLAQANPDAAAIGRKTRKVFEEAGTWENLKQHTTTFTGTVTEAANAVVVGSVDAAIVWDANVPQYPDLEAVAVPLLAKHPVNVAIGVLTVSTQPTAALRFARYLAARDKGLLKLKEMGYDTVEGDTWAEKPTLLLFAGAMLRPAIEATVTEFEEREGVTVTRVYNGCGILVAQMQTDGQAPDGYFACDLSFMEQVHAKFEKPLEMSANRLVILVPKDNPRDIHTLQDLAKPGLRVGVGHEKQCALGALTQATLREAQLRDPIMKNVKTQLPTGDMLINELRLGALDAVIAYISNKAEAGDELKAIPVDVKCALAVQPVAVGKTSDHKYLMQRLINALQTTASKERFTKLGFTWKATK